MLNPVEQQPAERCEDEHRGEPAGDHPRDRRRRERAHDHEQTDQRHEREDPDRGVLRERVAEHVNERGQAINAAPANAAILEAGRSEPNHRITTKAPSPTRAIGAADAFMKR